MSVPYGMIDGLPTGLMIIAGHWDEAAIYKAAHAPEQTRLEEVVSWNWREE
jgi:Asp-tRNA(Asn)/Glu-tRNA(Gln) amidotransferase A subunit family amidase